MLAEFFGCSASRDCCPGGETNGVPGNPAGRRQPVAPDRARFEGLTEYTRQQSYAYDRDCCSSPQNNQPQLLEHSPIEDYEDAVCQNYHQHHHYGAETYDIPRRSVEPFTAVRSFLGEEEDDDESMPHDATSKRVSRRERPPQPYPPPPKAWSVCTLTVGCSGAVIKPGGNFTGNFKPPTGFGVGPGGGGNAGGAPPLAGRPNNAVKRRPLSQRDHSKIQRDPSKIQRNPSLQSPLALRAPKSQVDSPLAPSLHRDDSRGHSPVTLHAPNPSPARPFGPSPQPRVLHARPRPASMPMPGLGDQTNLFADPGNVLDSEGHDLSEPLARRRSLARPLPVGRAGSYSGVLHVVPLPAQARAHSSPGPLASLHAGPGRFQVETGPDSAGASLVTRARAGVPVDAAEEVDSDPFTPRALAGRGVAGRDVMTWMGLEEKEAQDSEARGEVADGARRLEGQETEGRQRIGVGVACYERVDGSVVVDFLSPGSSVHGQVQAGDIIQCINGREMKGAGVECAQAMLRGAPFTHVLLGLRRSIDDPDQGQRREVQINIVCLRR